MVRLSTERAKEFASQSRRDPLTKQPFAAGQDVVFCAICKSAHLRISWAALGKCPCGGTRCIDDIEMTVVPVRKRGATKRGTFVLMLLSVVVGNIVGCVIAAKMFGTDIADAMFPWYLALPFCLTGSFFATRLDARLRRKIALFGVLASSGTVVWIVMQSGYEWEWLDISLLFVLYLLLFTVPSIIVAKCLRWLAK